MDRKILAVLVAAPAVLAVVVATRPAKFSHRALGRDGGPTEVPFLWSTTSCLESMVTLRQARPANEADLRWAGLGSGVDVRVAR